MSQDNLFNYNHFKFVRLAIFLVLACVLAYLVYTPEIVSYGGTWLGYGLGTLGALLIVWLMWLGVRKRQYAKNSGNLRGWVSAHVYLGMALAFVATLHTGFQIGWNVHTLAYVLMILVILSGMWGLSLYVRMPQLMSNTLNRKSPGAIVEEIESLDKEALKLVKTFQSESLVHLIKRSMSQGIFNASRQRKFGLVRNCETSKACDVIQKKMHENGNLIGLYENQIKRLKSLKQLRLYYCQKYWLEVWLLFHVPLSFALLAALIAHVVSVFYYW